MPPQPFSFGASASPSASPLGSYLFGASANPGQLPPTPTGPMAVPKTASEAQGVGATVHKSALQQIQEMFGTGPQQQGPNTAIFAELAKLIQASKGERPPDMVAESNRGTHDQFGFSPQAAWDSWGSAARKPPVQGFGGPGRYLVGPGTGGTKFGDPRIPWSTPEDNYSSVGAYQSPYLSRGADVGVRP